MGSDPPKPYIKPHRRGGTTPVTHNDNAGSGVVMTRYADSRPFSAREIRYLQSLPAVERVTQDRITYTEEFKRDCIRRYNAGESPAQIFRRAGLDSSLVGYKRIERCIARWRLTVKPAPDDEDGESFDVPDDKRWVEPVTPPVDATRRSDPAERDERLVSYDISELLKSHDADTDILELIISQQARRIDALEREVEQLRDDLRNAHK